MNNDSTGESLHSKHGLNQGDQLSMFAYVIITLHISRTLKLDFATVHQPWYANDAGAGAGAVVGKTCAMFKRSQELLSAFG
jgi:hypothetical protein